MALHTLVCESGDKNDTDFVLSKTLLITKTSRPDSAKIDEETKTYVEMFFSKLRDIKPLVLEAYQTNNNLSNEERKSLSKLAKLTEEKKIVICRAARMVKIVILHYEDYDAIMTKELQQFEKLDVSVEGCDAYLEKLRKDCNNLMVKLHNLGAVNDELLLHVTGIKCKSNSYRKVNGVLAKIFCCNTPPTPTRFSKHIS